MRAQPVDRPATPQARAFAKGRARAFARLDRDGMLVGQARAWLNAWDFTTTGLDDFRKSADFWELGYRFAREEWQRGHPSPDISDFFAEGEASGAVTSMTPGGPGGDPPGASLAT